MLLRRITAGMKIPKLRLVGGVIVKCQKKSLCFIPKLFKFGSFKTVTVIALFTIQAPFKENQTQKVVVSAGLQ
jgi:hypothetical protein